MKNKLQIVFLDFDDIRNPLLGAGQASATYQIAKRLVKKGHKVTVLSSRFPGSKDRTQDGIRYTHIGLGTNNIKVNNAAYILSVPLAVSKVKADIVVECFTAPISTLLSPLFTKIPVVIVPASFEAERFSKLYHLPFHLIEKYGARIYKYHLPLSEFTDEKMKKLNKNIIAKIVPEGVSEEFFAIKKKKAKHILFLGRFDMGQKGIDLLLQAYKKAAKTLSYPLVIAGHGPDEQKIKALITKLGLDEQVAMVGSAYGEVKERLLSESIAVALPSRHETFSCFGLEALASGLPLLVFRIPGLSWLNDACAVQAKPFSVEQYAKALRTVESAGKMRLMSKNARLHAGNFTWDSVVAEYESFFYEILAREDSQLRIPAFKSRVVIRAIERSSYAK